MLREIENAKTVRNEDVQVGDYIIANHISATGGADANLLEGRPFEDTVAKVDGIINVKGVVNLVTSGKLLNGITDVAKGDSWTVVRPNKAEIPKEEEKSVPFVVARDGRVPKDGTVYYVESTEGHGNRLEDAYVTFRGHGGESYGYYEDIMDGTVVLVNHSDANALPRVSDDGTLKAGTHYVVVLTDGVADIGDELVFLHSVDSRNFFYNIDNEDIISVPCEWVEEATYYCSSCSDMDGECDCGYKNGQYRCDVCAEAEMECVCDDDVEKKAEQVHDVTSVVSILMTR